LSFYYDKIYVLIIEWTRYDTPIERTRHCVCVWIVETHRPDGALRVCTWWSRVVPMTDQRRVRVVNTWYVTVQGTRPLTDAEATQPEHCPRHSSLQYRTYVLIAFVS